MDCRVRGERSDAVLRTAMPGNDEGRKKETIEGSGTPTDAVFRVRTSGCGARHGEIGLRRPAAAGALACRRSTDGSSLGTRHRQGAASGHASWDVGFSADPVVVPIPGAAPTQFVRALPAFTCPSPASTSQPGL